MLVSRLRRRLPTTPWIRVHGRRHLNDWKNDLGDEYNRSRKASERKILHNGDWGLSSTGDGVSNSTLAQHSSTGKSSPSAEHVLVDQSAGKVKQAKKKPSLMEQLFPAEKKRLDGSYEQKPRELPPMPPSEPISYRPEPPAPIHRDEADTSVVYRSPQAQRLYQRREQDMEVEGKQPTILLLRNASLNLTEEDFRRVTPQGKHLEGWTVEQSIFTKIVPGRDLATLAQQNYYYLLFAHQMAAFIYQGHVSRLSALAMHYTPSSVTSPAAPPPGYQLNDGTDLYAALQSYSLTPASQNLELRQLKPPLSPLLKAILQYQGYPSFVDRPEKSPYEVRLTLDGPQLKVSTIQFILHESALARSLSWSGGNARIPRITIWEPQFAPSPTDKKSSGRAEAWGLRIENETIEEGQLKSDMERQHAAPSEPQGASMEADEDNEDDDDYDDNVERLRRRLPMRVYIVGFYTESAAQAFIRYWHRRPMCWEVNGAVTGAGISGDLPPIANAELLW